MKRMTLWATALLLGLCVVTGYAADEKKSDASNTDKTMKSDAPAMDKTAPKEKGAMKNAKLDAVFAKMSTKLKLTDAQQKSMHEILMQHRAEAMEANKSGKDDKEMMKMSKERMEAMNKKVAAVLSPEQLEGFKSYKKELHEAMHEGMEMHHGRHEMMGDNKDIKKDMHEEKKEEKHEAKTTN